MSNCIIYAVFTWLKQGGYIVIRKSRRGWWPHFLWSLDLKTFKEYYPLYPKRRKIPPPLFRGYVKSTVGDGAAQKLINVKDKVK